MFSLDEAIARWRQQMAGGIETAEDLDELESHLRDDVDSRVRSGASPEQALELAVRTIGQASVLQSEFDKVRGQGKTHERVKQAILIFAGIPNHYVPTAMNTSFSNIEPRWATYLKAVGFLVPAIVLWAFSAVFIVPKLQQLCADAGLFGPTLLWHLTHSSIQTVLFFREHALLLGSGVLALLMLLEWRSTNWPRYRRATVGFGVFLLNSLVLGSMFVMFLAAILAAPALAHHIK